MEGHQGEAVGMSPLEQVKAVNVLINRWPYRTDMDVWGVMDYWERHD